MGLELQNIWTILKFTGAQKSDDNLQVVTKTTLLIQKRIIKKLKY